MREHLIKIFWILFSFKGKIGRVEYLIGLISLQVFQFLLGFCIAVVLALLYHCTAILLDYAEWFKKEHAIMLVKAICYPIGFFMFTALVKKRLRDLEFSQWWTILLIIPPINLIGIILFLSLKGVVKNKVEFIESVKI